MVAILGLGGCLVASGEEGSTGAAAPGESIEPEAVASTTEAIVRPSFLTNYYWNSANDKGVTKTMISDQEGFCALTEIGGRFRTTSDFVGVWQSGGHFTLSGTTNQSGEAVHATATCVPISQFSNRGWAFSGVWYTGWTSNGTTNTGGTYLELSGWDMDQSQCWVNGLGGDFSGSGFVETTSSNGPNWYLGLGGAGYAGQSIVGRASCAKFTGPTTDERTTVRKVWTPSNGTGPKNRNVKLAKASTHFCYFVNVGLGGGQWNDSVYITYSSTDGYYYLTGSTSGGSSRPHGIARCIAYDQL